MSRTNIYILVSVFVLVVIVLFAASYVMRTPQSTTADPVATTTPNEIAAEELPRITAKHFYTDGVHTLVGEIDMPTPCDLLDHDVMVRESMPEQVQIDFTVINNAETCAQVITPQRFMVEVAVSEDASFTATLRGDAVELNLVPAAPGETPDEFEVFIKG